MSSLIPASEVAQLTGAFGDHFDTFALETITVYKESLRIPRLTNVEPLAGYGDTSVEQNFDFEPVFSSFACLATWEKGRAEKWREIPESKIKITANMVRVKVGSIARDFINNGKNERFEIDGLSYNNIADESVQNYLGLKYYIFYLEKTN